MLSLILAGLLSLPFFVWSLMVVPTLGALVLLPLCLVVSRSSNKDASETKPCNVIITGGSSGIGLAIAQECCTLKHVKSITMIARNETKLQAAKKQLQEYASTSVDIQVISADVTNYSALEQACGSIAMQESTYLFICAGISHPGYFCDIPPDVFESQMNLNYLGSVYTTKALLSKIKSGTITLTSSAAGQVGVFGFTAYSPTKFALRGLAESLHMELTASDVNIQLAFPNDTNTPGYREEQNLKPKECHLISESGGLSEASDIAKTMVKQAMQPNPPFFVYFGLEGWMLTALTAGMSPVSSTIEALTQVALMGVFRFISLFYLNDFWNIVKRCASEKEGDKEDSTAQDKKEQ